MGSSVLPYPVEAIEARLAELKMTHLDDDRPFFSPLAARSCFTPYPDRRAYSPPPSPTRLSSISRFQSPVCMGSCATPSLMNGSSSPSIMFSPSLAQTPARYATTRGARPDTTFGLGLGISGLLLHDGSVFDGMGALPKRDESSAIGFFMDEADDSGSWCDHESLGYPEQEEDAWRQGISSVLSTEELSFYGTRHRLFPVDTPHSLQDRRPSVLPRTNTPTLPSEPLADDVFFSHMPLSSTPRCEGSFKERRNLSRAVVSSWRRDVRQAV